MRRGEPSSLNTRKNMVAKLAYIEDSTDKQHLKNNSEKNAQEPSRPVKKS
jgi:hypothetical protein